MNFHDDSEHKSTSQTETHVEPGETKTQETIDFKEQFLRVSADFANYKKRVEKERLDWMQTAERLVIQKMLPIMDDLERALTLAQSKTSAEQNSWLEGFILIQKNVKKTFEELGVQEIDASGTFNPEFHEALMNVQASDKQSGTVVDVLRKGYILKGKVIRPAQVSVAQ